MKTPFKRKEKYFHLRVIKLLMRQCIANDIGVDACWLLTVIVTQSQAVEHKRPVTYFNEQLLPVCGFGSKSRLVTARRKAQESGWLEYEPGNKQTAGKYQVQIPKSLEGTWDGPIDEAIDEAIEDQPDLLSVRNLNGENTSSRTEGKSEQVRRQRLIQEELETKQEPPPPAWEVVEVAFRNAGLINSADAVNTANLRGLSPEETLSLIKEFTCRAANGEVSSPGILVTRIRNFRAGDDPSTGWPNSNRKIAPRPSSDKIEAAARRIRDDVFKVDRDASDNSILTKAIQQIRKGPPREWPEQLSWGEREQEIAINHIRN